VIHPAGPVASAIVALAEFLPVSGAAFVALTPAMTALMGIPILGEWPSAIDWVAIAMISIGVYAVSSGPLPMSWRRASPSDEPLTKSPRSSE